MWSGEFPIASRMFTCHLNAAEADRTNWLKQREILSGCWKVGVGKRGYLCALFVGTGDYPKPGVLTPL